MKEEIEIKNVTPEQLVEFFGGEITEENGLKIWTSPKEQYENKGDYYYRIEGNVSRNDISGITVIAKRKYPKV